MMMRVLIYGMTDNLGGMETFILSYVQRIPKNEIQFDLISPFERIAIEDEIRKMGGTVIHLPNRKQHYFSYHKAFDEFMKNNAKSYNAVWLNDCMFCNLDVLKYAKKYGIKTRIIHAHNSQPMGSTSQLIRHTLNKYQIRRYATHYWACSSLAAEWSYPKCITENRMYTVIPNAIDIEKYKFNDRKRREVRKALHLEDNIVVGNVGRLHFQKNQFFLLDVFREYIKAEPKAILMLVGSGEDENRLKLKCKTYGLEQQVRFMGLRQDVPELLQAMDIFVMPSRFEGFGIVAIEAQAAGLPTLMSDVLPKETTVTDYAVRLSLNDSCETWSAQMRAMLNKMPKCDKSKQLKKSDFDIEKAALDLERRLKDLA